MGIQQQKSFKVLLIGDSCQDIFIYGRCNRINPEAPVPILDYTKSVIKAGMALNVQKNLTSFGVEVKIITNIEKLIKTRYIDEKSNQQILRLDEENKVNPMVIDYKILNKNYDSIVISDYDKGFISSKLMFDIASFSKCPVFIDSKKTYLPKENCFIKINDNEYSKLKDKDKHNNLIITRGSGGAEYNNVLYPAHKVNVYDVVGAGDTFLAALVFGYLKFKKIEDAILLANKASSIAVSNRGTYALTEEDINEICN